MEAALITPSYSGDFDLAVDLCASVDRFVDKSIEHVLIVPARDFKQFSALANDRRRVVTQETLLPKGWQPLPRQFSKILPMPRDILWTSGGPVRGWIAQQVIKLSADRVTNAEAIVYADSDLVFVKPFTLSSFARDELIRLYHRPGETSDSRMHWRWHRKAASWLGIEPKNYFGSDFIGQPITWRRSTLQALQKRLEEVNGRPWQTVLARSSSFSEWILYGVFATELLGVERAGHFLDTEDLALSSWHYNLGDQQSRARFTDELSAHHIAILIQSTERLSVAARRALIQSAADRAAR